MYARFVVWILFLVTVCACAEKPAPPAGPTPELSTNSKKNGDDSESFEELASEYESDERVIWQKPELVISLLGNLENKTVADIGAGTGYFAFRLAEQGANVVGIDIDPRAILWMEKEKKAYPVEIQQRFSSRLATEDSPNLIDGEVDIVLMVNTYIYIADRVAYFTDLKKGLKPNARVLIIDFKKKTTSIGPNSEDRIALDQVERELRQAGYTVESTDDSSLDFQYIVMASKQ